MAIDRRTGRKVALKKVRMDKETEGFPLTAIREIKILQNVNHDCIVSLEDVVVTKGGCRGRQRGRGRGRWRGRARRRRERVQTH